MAEKTDISWTDRTWSPWEGCTKVSLGCDHCYAASMNGWLRKGENWGPGAPRRLYSDEHWRKPIMWNTQLAKRGDTARVFPSVCDPFDNEAPEAERLRFWRLIEATPHLTWLLLTKRIGNVARMVPPAWLQPGGWPRNVWLGATVVNQEEVDRDIQKLLSIPAWVRFLSCEPLLGFINLQQACTKSCPNGDCFRHSSGMRMVIDSENGGTLAECICSRLNGLHLVIIGGESGRSAREFSIDAARDIVQQCQRAGVPVHVKQMGARPVEDDGDGGKRKVIFFAKAGRDVSQWPADLRVQEFPDV